jgi:hypothetical protein
LAERKKHTQWPGTGVHGDETFDNFFASQMKQIANRKTVEGLSRDAGVALLDRIDPPFFWCIRNRDHFPG